MTEPMTFEKGHVFEKMATTKKGDYECHTVYQSTVGQHKLLVCGEVDAQDNDGNVVELKEKDPAKYDSDWKLRTWFQSFVVGIKNIHYGSWEKDTTLTRINMYPVEHLRTDDADLCFGSIKLVLDRLIDVMSHGELCFLHMPKGERKIEIHKVKRDCVGQEGNHLLARPNFAQKYWFHE